MRFIVVDDGTEVAAALLEALRMHRELQGHSLQRVLVTGDSSLFIRRAEGTAAIREYRGDPTEVARYAREADVLVVHLAPVDGTVLEAAPSLRLVACARSAPVNVDVLACAARGIPVIHAPGRNAKAVAELTIGLIIALTRRVVELDRRMRTTEAWKLWEPNLRRTFTGTELEGLTLGLVGFGRIGREVARLATTFGMRVVAHDPYVEPHEMIGRGVTPCSLETLLGCVDILSLHVPETPETVGLLNSERLAQLKPGAFVINTARGSLIDEDALARYLKSGRIAGAALDVYSIEPPKTSSLWQELDNVIVLPHIGGLTRQVPQRAAQMVVDDVVRWLKGEPMQHVYSFRSSDLGRG